MKTNGLGTAPVDLGSWRVPGARREPEEFCYTDLGNSLDDLGISGFPEEFFYTDLGSISFEIFCCTSEGAGKFATSEGAGK